MKQIHFTKVENKEVLNSLKVECKENLIAPGDDYFDALIDGSDHWQIKKGEQSIGFACINDKGKLEQFFLLPKHLDKGQTIFKQMLEFLDIKEGFVCTNNLGYLSIALHFQKIVTVEDYLFSDIVEEERLEKEGDFRLAKETDLDNLVEFCHQTVKAPKDWLEGYIKKWISREEYFILENENENENEILGICEVRTGDDRPLVASLGVIVSENYRKKGLGTFLIGKAKEIAINRNQKPICSCKKDNIGSLKAIQNNGFRIIHQVLRMTF